jgi:hypothetical protein
VGLGLAGILIVSAIGFAAATQRTTPEPFSPVAPAAAINAALRSNLKLVQDWLKDRDYASAAETAEGLAVLAQAYQCQSAQSGWRERVAALRESCSILVAQAKARDAAGCTQAVASCAALLAELSQNLPSESNAVEQNFKPVGSTKTLMKLLDGTYADAKASKGADELMQLAYALAEGTNVVRHLRLDDAWREAAREARDAALRVAAKAERDDIAGARAELKSVRNRCEACHQAFKR